MLKLFNKKYLFLAAVFLLTVFTVVFLFHISAFAQSNQYGMQYAQNIGLSTEDIRVSVVKIIRTILGILGILALIIILYGGFVWMSSQGNPQKIELAKKILLNATIGLIIILMAFGIVQWIFSVLSSSQGSGSNSSLCTANQCYGCMRCRSDQSGQDFDLSCDNSCSSFLSPDSFITNDVQTAHGDILPGHYDTNQNKSNVYWCSKIQTVFNHDINEQTVKDAINNQKLHIAINSTDKNAPGNWTTRGNVLSFTPNNHTFDNRDTDHEEHFPNSLTDIDNKSLSGCSLGTDCEVNSPPDYQWNFYVGDEGDAVAPYVVKTYPQSSDQDHPDDNVDLTPIIEVNFSENIDYETVTDLSGIHPNSSNIFVWELDNDLKRVRQVNNDDNTLWHLDTNKDKGFRMYLEGANKLKAFTNYEITVQNIQDLCGNIMDPNPYSWRFSTNDKQPGVNSYYPVGNNVCPSSKVSITFNTSMYYSQIIFNIQTSNDPNSLSSYIVEPSKGIISSSHNVGSGNIDGIFKVVDVDENNLSTHYKVYEFSPAKNLNENTTYHISVNTDKVIDIDGNTLSQNWDFIVTDLSNCVCTPYISYLSKEAGPVGDCLTINGYCFKGTAAQPASLNHIYFDNTDAIIGNGYTDSHVGTTVPNNFNSGSRPKISLTIDYSSGNSVPPSNSKDFLVTAGQANGPCLWSIAPNSGHPGSTVVTLNGLRFGNYTDNTTHNVIFNQQQIFNVTDANNWADSKIINVTVPAGTIDGDVTVNNDQGESNAIPFDAQYCGDNTIDPGEECDGTNLNNKTCSDIGWLGGDLACNNNCHFDTTNCSNAPQVLEHSQCNTSCVGGTQDGQNCQQDSDCPSGSCSVTQSPSPNPYRSAQDVCLNASVSAEFNTDIQSSTFNTGNIFLQLCDDQTCNNLNNGQAVPHILASITAVDARSFVLSPDSSLHSNSWYQATITTGITSTSGVPMQENYTWRFRTKSDGSATCPLSNVDVKPDNNNAGSNQSLSYYAVPIGPNCIILQGADNYDWVWSIDKPDLDVTVTENLTNDSHATVLTADKKGTIYVRATTENKSDLGKLNINFDTCTLDSDCNDPNGDGNIDCPGSICDLKSNRCTPVINSLTPASGPTGRWITLQGCHFKSPRGNGNVDFIYQNDITQVTQYPCNQVWTDKQIIIGVPKNLVPQTYQVRVTDSYGLISNLSSFNVITQCLDGIAVPDTGVPGLCSLSPNIGYPGTKVNLNGENFGTNQDEVTFNGHSATINSWSSSNIEAEAPADSQGDVFAIINSCPSNALTFGYSSGGIGDACDAESGNFDVDNQPICDADNHLCWDNLYCDKTTCTCQQPPKANVIEASRYPYPSGLCRNSVIGATFDQLMDHKTFSNNNFQLWHLNVSSTRPNDNCVAAGLSNGTGGTGGQTGFLQHNNFFKLIKLVKRTFNYILNSKAKAQTATNWWCPIDGHVVYQDIGQGVDNCNNTEGCTKFIFTPNDLLDNAGTYKMHIIGGFNGVKSKLGGEITTTSPQPIYLQQPSYYWAFTINGPVCKIDHVQVDVSYASGGQTITRNNTNYDYYTCAGRDDCPDDISNQSGNQHSYLAQAYDSHQAALTANYEWSEYDPDNLIEVGPPTDQQTTEIMSNPDSGKSLVRIQALDPNPNDTIEYGSAISSVNVTNFMCKNPWPSLSTFPFQDRGGNCTVGSGQCLDMTYSTYYCRDYGHDENFCLGGDNNGMQCTDNADCPAGRCADFTEDDLPAPDNGLPVIKSSQEGYCVGGSNHGQTCNNSSQCANGGYCYNVLKEYIYNFNQGRCDKNGNLCRSDEDCVLDEESCTPIHDLIGIRIYNNDEHLSPGSWYEKYANKPGSYSIKEHNNYEAIESGRTTYIGMAVDSNPDGAHNIYTDMFLMSYNDNYNANTLNIYDQLLANLKFNTNGITDVRICSGLHDYCQKDSDCPAGESCNAQKTKLSRDVIRMGHLSEMNYHLALYRGACSAHLNLPCLVDSDCPDANKIDNPETCIIKNSSYPLLKSGTYISGQSVSVWKSWANNFASLLGINPLLDPLNEVFCNQDSGYSNECWNEETNDFQCASGSHMYHYRVNNNGNSYSLFTNMEYSNSGWQPDMSGFTTQVDQDICSPGCYNLEYDK